MNKPEYSIVIPVYNSTESVVRLCLGIQRLFETEILKSYEIILVNDGSPNPESWLIIKKLAQESTNITAILLSRNFGKEAALFAGFSLARGEYIITMDDDLQHSPQDIPKLIEHKEHDIVIVAFPKKYHSFAQRLTSKIRVWFEKKYFHRPQGIQMTPFKLINRQIIDQLLEIKTVYPYTSGYLYYLTSDIINVKGTHHPRQFGRSHFNMKRRFQVFSNLLINNTPFLLRFMIKTGILISLVSFLIGFYFIIRRLTGMTTINGWTSLMVTISFLSGVIILFIGIVGEYLLRLISINENKPLFVISKIVKND